MSDLPIGPRKDAVEKLERDLEVAMASFDLALDTRDFFEAALRWDEVKRLRWEVEYYTNCPLANIPGAYEWYDQKERARRLELEKK